MQTLPRLQETDIPVRLSCSFGSYPRSRSLGQAIVFQHLNFSDLAWPIHWPIQTTCARTVFSRRFSLSQVVSARLASSRKTDSNPFHRVSAHEGCRKTVHLHRPVGSAIAPRKTRPTGPEDLLRSTKPDLWEADLCLAPPGAPPSGKSRDPARPSRRAEPWSCRRSG